MSGSMRDTASRIRPSFVRLWLRQLRLALQGHLTAQNLPPATGKPAGLYIWEGYCSESKTSTSSVNAKAGIQQWHSGKKAIWCILQLAAESMTS